MSSVVSPFRVEYQIAWRARAATVTAAAVAAGRGLRRLHSSLLLFVFFLLGTAAFDRDAITLPSDLILWGQLQAARANDTIKKNTM